MSNTSEPASAKYLHCPRCGNDDLSLTEVHEELGTSRGRHRVARGRSGTRGIVPATLFYFEPGEPVRILAWCEDGCGHEWRPRRATIDAYLTLDSQ